MRRGAQVFDSRISPLLWGFLLVMISFPRLALAQTSDSALTKSLAIIKEADEKGSPRLVELGIEGLMPVLFNPKNVDRPERSEGIWIKFKTWLSAHGPSLSFETLERLRLALAASAAAVDGSEDYHQTAWKPSLLWGGLTAVVLEPTVFLWLRKLMKKMAIKWQWGFNRKKCCKSAILSLLGERVMRFYKKRTWLVHMVGLSALTSMSYYYFLYSDEEPGDAEVRRARQQIIPQIRELQKKARRESN